MAKDFNVKWFGREFLVLATKENVRAMNIAAKLVERETKTALKRQGGYRPYRRGGVIHWSSMPGRPPALDTGILRNSIASFVKVARGFVKGSIGPDIDHIKAKAEAGTDVNYGLYLELGTRHMAARPFLRPTLRRLGKKINKIFIKANS